MTLTAETSRPSVTAAAGRVRRRRLLPRVAPYLQAAPLTVTLLLFLLVPILTIVAVSFWDYDSVRIYPDFVLTNYTELLTSPVTWKTYLNTLKYAALTWAITLGIGFTVAYFLAFHVRSTTWQMVLFLVCTIPFWTSNIIRMISWIRSWGATGCSIPA